jgi:D-tyrosyl-tRNA(Tyr) deacylase
MRAVVQRVSKARVTVSDEITGEIGRGFLVLLGVGKDDKESDADYLAGKIAGLRIFDDENGKINLALAEVGGAVLAVSQFTLYADTLKGNRPAFNLAAPPERARQLYQYFVDKLRASGLRCETGRFQAAMQVELVNDGPVTILLDSLKTF